MRQYLNFVCAQKLQDLRDRPEALEEWLEELEAPLDPMAQADIVFARIAREQGG